MGRNAVTVENVTMRFNLATEKYSGLKEYVIKLMKHQLLFEEFFALRNISFEIKKGDAFAIVGANGSGKSTLLKLISGIFAPTEGHISVDGTIVPLIELGAGFDFELTARENIFLNGAVLGYDEKFMKRKYDEIVDFSELEKFMDVPLKNYSSGMAARLGFSIATMVVPDILIIDEILSVGDADFQLKCEKRIHSMLQEGTTLIFVSHSADQVKRLCNRALWIDHGKERMLGEAKAVCDAYHKEIVSD